MVATASQAKTGSSQRAAGALAEARRSLAALAPRLAEPQADVLDRLLADLEAAGFHAEHIELSDLARPMLLAVLGGTGTGKSTLVNRLCGASDAGDGALTATSFRRTFTEGPVAIAATAEAIPEGWLGLDHEAAERAQLPARGRADELAVIDHDADITRRLTLIDTPDLDGDVPPVERDPRRLPRPAEPGVQAEVEVDAGELDPERSSLPLALLGQRHRDGGIAVHVLRRVQLRLSVADEDRQAHGA